MYLFFYYLVREIKAQNHSLIIKNLVRKKRLAALSLQMHVSNSLGPHSVAAIAVTVAVTAWYGIVQCASSALIY